MNPAFSNDPMVAGPGSDPHGCGAERPLVSVITAVLNGERYLDGTIGSVLAQTYRPIEYIIVDGGSTDGTLDIIRGYGDRIAAWVSEPDTGIYDAWNKGLALARGRWICFLGSDDLLLSDAVEAYMAFIVNAAAANLDYVSSRVDAVDEDLRFIRTIGRPWQWRRFQKHNNLAHVGSFHNRRLFETYGRFDTRYRIAGDYEFLLRPGRRLRAAFLDRVTVKWRFSGVSHSRKALAETMHVKIHRIGRNRLLSYLEYLIGALKLSVNRMRLGKMARGGGDG